MKRRVCSVGGVNVICSLPSYLLITEPTAHVVIPHAIKVLQDKGYKLVTVAECLGMKPYQSVSDPQNVCFSIFVVTYPLIAMFYSQGSWTC
jgi:hypothetical protein